MSPLVNDYTRVTLNTSKIIYVIMCSQGVKHEQTGVYSVSLSDHYMVYTTVAQLEQPQLIHGLV